MPTQPEKHAQGQETPSTAPPAKTPVSPSSRLPFAMPSASITPKGTATEAAAAQAPHPTAAPAALHIQALAPAPVRGSQHSPPDHPQPYAVGLARGRQEPNHKNSPHATARSPQTLAPTSATATPCRPKPWPSRSHPPSSKGRGYGHGRKAQPEGPTRAQPQDPAHRPTHTSVPRSFPQLGPKPLAPTGQAPVSGDGLGFRYQYKTEPQGPAPVPPRTLAPSRPTGQDSRKRRRFLGFRCRQEQCRKAQPYAPPKSPAPSYR